MSNDKEEISLENGETRIKLKTEIGVEGELSCLIVYSERRHIDYI